MKIYCVEQTDGYDVLWNTYFARLEDAEAYKVDADQEENVLLGYYTNRVYECELHESYSKPESVKQEKTRTPIQEAIKMVQDYRKSGFADATTCNNILLHLGLILKEEKEVMVDFAYKCRNLMAEDEFSIAHWYDKTFDSDTNSDTNSDTAPSQNVK